MISPSPKFLFLGEQDNPLYLWLKACEAQILQTTEKIDASFIINNNIEFIVSYGYRHIISQVTLNALPDNKSAINLHISYLPWNRGADPNLWSFIDSTPKGVTIHLIDQGLDTGNILLQKNVIFNNSEETLSSSYQHLQLTIENLFKDHWHNIKNKKIKSVVQQGKGSIHVAADKVKIQHLLTNGWKTPISQLNDNK